MKKTINDLKQIAKFHKIIINYLKMKQLLTFVFILLVSTSFGQVSKKPVVKTGEDSISIKGRYQNDTAKISYFYYVEDGSINWGKGYLVARSFVPTGGQKLSAGQTLFDNKWVAVRKEVLESIYDYKEFNWK